MTLTETATRADADPVRYRTDPPWRDDRGTTSCPGLPAPLHPGRATAVLQHRLPQDRVPPPAPTTRPGRPTPPGDHRLRMPPTAATGTSASNARGCGTFARRVGIGGACPNCDGARGNFRPARPGGGHHHQQIANPRARRPQRPSTAWLLHSTGGFRAAHATGPPLQRQGSLRDRCATASGPPLTPEPLRPLPGSKQGQARGPARRARGARHVD
jgi:hypothetical protein